MLVLNIGMSFKKSTIAGCNLHFVSFDAGNTSAFTLVINTGLNLRQMNKPCLNDILTNQLHCRGPV